MAIICSGYAGTGTRIVGMWDAALHVQYVVSIANSAIDVDWLPARRPACLAAVYNPVACLLSVQLGEPSPKVLTTSLCIQILGMRHCHSTICSISFFFLFSIFLPSSTLFFLCYFFVGRTQPQHINFRTDIGQPFLQPVDAVRSVRHY